MLVVAGVVTFNPDLALLRETLEAISQQVDRVLVVDNGSSGAELVRRECDRLSGVTLECSETNRGMSVALNRIMRAAAAGDAEHVVLLDQDSVAAPGMIAALLDEIDPAVAMVAAYAVDRNLGEPLPDDRDQSRDVDQCITSGSLCRVAAWRQVGGYDERLFVDFVDFDLCLRLRLAGWRIRLTPRAVFEHGVGSARRHGDVTAYHHSAARNYHLARDMVLFARIHRRAPRDLLVEPRGLPATVRALLHRMRTIARFEPDAAAKVAALAWGILRGLAVPLGTRSPADPATG